MTQLDLEPMDSPLPPLPRPQTLRQMRERVPRFPARYDSRTPQMLLEPPSLELSSGKGESRS
jgi:hypothetical protein